MEFSYVGGILEVANVFISGFVLVYAWSFLRQTADVRDRRPWVFLFIAAAVFFVFEVVGVLDVFDISRIPGLRNFLESAFIALVLFVFIFQYDLILKSDLILITRKIAREEEREQDDALIRERLSRPLTRRTAEEMQALESNEKRPTKKAATQPKALKRRR